MQNSGSVQGDLNVDEGKRGWRVHSGCAGQYFLAANVEPRGLIIVRARRDSENLAVGGGIRTLGRHQHLAELDTARSANHDPLRAGERERRSEPPDEAGPAITDQVVELRNHSNPMNSRMCLSYSA